MNAPVFRSRVPYNKVVLREVAPRIPGSLVAVLFGILAVGLLDLDDKGVAIVGSIESGLPSLGLPDGIEGSDYFTVRAAVEALRADSR